ncbi:MAG: hypothetical protein ACTSQE_13575 [Candidatus Heimdallarchaeaceae archaeon]
MDYQDVLTYQPKQVMVILDEKQRELIRDQQYNPITRVLREGPLTVQQITERYNNLIKKECKIVDQGEEEIEKRQRSEKSIYRYLKDLEKAGLVTVAGQRVIIGQTATQKLWSRTAKIFIVKTQSCAWWMSKEGEKFAEKINAMLNLLFPEYESKCKYIHDLLTQLNRLAEDELERLFVEFPEQVNEILGECDFEDLNHILKELHLLILLLKRDKVERILSSCLE